MTKEYIQFQAHVFNVLAGNEDRDMGDQVTEDEKPEVDKDDGEEIADSDEIKLGKPLDID